MPGLVISAFLLPSDLSQGNRNLRLFQREPFAGSLLSGKYAVPSPFLFVRIASLGTDAFRFVLQGASRYSYYLGLSALRHPPRVGDSEGTPTGGERSPEPPFRGASPSGEKRFPLLGRFPQTFFGRLFCGDPFSICAHAHAPDLIRCMS